MITTEVCTYCSLVNLYSNIFSISILYTDLYYVQKKTVHSAFCFDNLRLF